METGSLEELAARRRRAIAKTKFLKTLAEEEEFMNEMDELKGGLDTLKAKLQKYRERRRRALFKMRERRKRAPSSFDEHYTNFMYSASAICMAVFIAMHVFRLMALLAFPELLMDCAIIVDNSTEITEVWSISIAWQLLLGTLRCESVLYDGECVMEGNETCLGSSSSDTND